MADKKLYTERHNLREEYEKTYLLNIEIYEILFQTCNKYRKNLTHIFSKTGTDNFSGQDYIAFDEKLFIQRLRVKIRNIFMNEHGDFSVPSNFYKDNSDNDGLFITGDYSLKKTKNEDCSLKKTKENYLFSIIDYIEYFAKNIRDISEQWNNSYRNYQYITCFETDKIFNKFKSEINEIFQDSGLLYELTDAKIVERIIDNPVLDSKENSFKNIKEEEFKKLLNEAINFYRKPQPEYRSLSVEKLWDAFERLKTYYSSDKKNSAEKIVKNIASNNKYLEEMITCEFKELTDIGNKCNIRHHEKNTILIKDFRYHDYLFSRCISLIFLAINFLEK